jgi:Zn-dependent metalloprotease
LPIVSSHPGSEVYVPGGLTYVLIDDTRGGGIETYDLNGVGGLPLSVAGIYAQGKSFTDVDNNWTQAEHHRSPGNDGALEAENDDIAWDAHWGAEVVYDYWLAKHNRLSFDGNSAKIKSFIHYGPAYDNAFWNGSAMTYGDGSGPTAAGFKALTSLDVCGHEIGHGVCSYTSDLIYQSESGAMNEAFSDIWAACIEHFAMTRAGSTVPSTAYRPFYIGEQIGANYDSPLRRMDDPKDQSNPDTYGGTNWVNPVCAPTLVNDQCGVHTNSGVLNKWFFLLTAGSKLGTRGPGTAAYYFPDSDDELNDLSNTYRVNGLGFDVSENITFITETLLTSSATYAEARDVSIAVAKAITGNPCDPVVESVTNAWYAVGVGAAFATPCVITFGFTFQPGFTITEDAMGTGCADGKTFYVPLLLPANSTATFSTGGTATLNADYTLPGTSISNSTPDNKQDTLSVFIKNDAIIEGSETIELSVALTNTGGNPVNTSFVITITDDDVVPAIGNDSITLINETFTGADGFADPPGWTEIMEIPEGTFDVINNPTPNGKNQWGIFGNQLAVTGKVFATNTALPGGTYNDLSESKSIVRSSLVNGSGLNTFVLHFDYTVQGEVDLTSGSTDPENLPVFDYMAIVYSMDGVNFTELNTGPYRVFASAGPAAGTYQIALPGSLDNKQFYLGFRWYNDGNAGGPVSVTIDNLTLKGLPRKLEKDLGHEGNETVGAGQDVYIYSQNDGELIARVNNASSHNYLCTSQAIEKAGNSNFTWYSDGTNLQKACDKIVRSVVTTDNSSNAYSISLYFSEAQIVALETATGLPRTSFSLHHTTAGSYSSANSTNTVSATTSYTAIAGVGGIFTATFTNGLGGSFALAGPIPQAPLPVKCIDFTAISTGQGVVLKWKVADEANNREFSVERSNDGITYTPVGFINATAANNGSYNFTDNNTAGLKSLYYRLKQTDVDGDFTYLCTTLRVKLDDRNAFMIGKVYPNPATGHEIFVNVISTVRKKIRIEIVSTSGQLIGWQQKEILPGTSRIALNARMITQGSYLIRFRDEDEGILDVQSIIRN